MRNGVMQRIYQMKTLTLGSHPPGEDSHNVFDCGNETRHKVSNDHDASKYNEIYSRRTLAPRPIFGRAWYRKSKPS